MEEKVREILDKKIRPLLQRDGGDVELVGVDNGKVKVRLRGACGCCPGAQMTLKMGIERLLKEDVPEVKEVIAV
jgi:Fe-S cluster biogenesis protein NfuA